MSADARSGRVRVDAIRVEVSGSERRGPRGGGRDAPTAGGEAFAEVGATGVGLGVETPGVEAAAMRVEAGAGDHAPCCRRGGIPPRLGRAGEAERRRRVRASRDVVRAERPGAEPTGTARAAIEGAP